jgi:hypothetical protein
MPDRWRGRAAGLAAGVLLTGAFGLLLPATTAGPAEERLVLTDATGARLAAVPLPPDGRFTLRYRNSLYRSTAEERFGVSPTGELVLQELAADELAVLDEYYVAVDTVPAPRGDSRQYVGRPALGVVLDELTLAATDRGRRTLLVEDRSAVDLWRFVTDTEPSVTLRVERGAP